MSTPAHPLPGAPPWPHCAHGAHPSADPLGCRGIRVPGHTACLAHLGDSDRTSYLACLSPGADIDHRGTPFTQPLLQSLLDALRDPATGACRLGAVRLDEAEFPSTAWFLSARFSGEVVFDGAVFAGGARFDRTVFSGPVRFLEARFDSLAGFEAARFSSTAAFDGAQFSVGAQFREVRFCGGARFEGARFSGHAWFEQAVFEGHAWFDEVEFSSPVRFLDARFDGYANFGGTRFCGTAEFSGAQFFHQAVFEAARFTGDADFKAARFSSGALFEGARFEGASVLGPLSCAGRVVLSGAVFGSPVTLELAAREVVCERTRWESTATVRLRYAAVDLSHAVLSAPVAVTAHPSPFTSDGTPVSEDLLTGPDRARVTSVRGVDAAHLVLTDTELTDCLFSGAFHLDQIRLEGRITFAHPPAGWHRRGVRPVRWTRRRTLAEEHHWRAEAAGRPARAPGAVPSPRQWRPRLQHPGLAEPASGPVDVAALYRQLRKAFEDNKNEPGAADFYYGECEMRRHDHTGTPRGERRLLRGYWLLSGYGLRASRAAGWLLAAMSVTVLLLMGFGLPTHDPDQATTGTLHGSEVRLSTSTPAPALHGGWSERMTWTRAEKASRVAINSVVFRASGQNLTTAGTYIEMTSRLLEPTLLALAALAVRGRVKR